jgi:hypothetical protein
MSHLTALFVSGEFPWEMLRTLVQEHSLRTLHLGSNKFTGNKFTLHLGSNKFTVDTTCADHHSHRTPLAPTTTRADHHSLPQ